MFKIFRVSLLFIKLWIFFKVLYTNFILILNLQMIYFGTDDQMHYFFPQKLSQNIVQLNECITKSGTLNTKLEITSLSMRIGLNRKNIERRRISDLKFFVKTAKKIIQKAKIVRELYENQVPI